MADVLFTVDFPRLDPIEKGAASCDVLNQIDLFLAFVHLMQPDDQRIIQQP